jgi:hypothetical protein
MTTWSFFQRSDIKEYRSAFLRCALASLLFHRAWSAMLYRTAQNLLVNGRTEQGWAKEPLK